ncbi:hypothetical protein RCO28_37920 [Streptomyces sp. LHD-70]|uniref:hypothetical protein n=1 Tax=Streptomyces sp. LHD-70 TaxID=3072140 RepID=UPI00280CD237|nr:hypothetical protein [Streptomyces sp. LHD-70]MDQ8708196.1 hypothetical protein [Streptomyces sp. LHD-70]
MSTPTIGLAPIDILTDQPVAPRRRYGLYSAATVKDTGPLRHAYATWSTDTCADGGYWALCNPEDPTAEDDNGVKNLDRPAWQTAFPFAIYAGIGCDRIGFDDAAARAKSRLGAAEERLVERALWQGRANIRPALNTTDATLLAKTPVSLTAAVALLEEALGESTIEAGLIHAPRRMAAPAASLELAKLDGPRQRTSLGATWVFGSGYTPSDTGPDAGPAADEGVAWLYGSGQAVVRRSPVQVEPGQHPATPGYFDPASNQAYALAERTVLITLDCPLFAVPVTDDTPQPAPLPAPTGLAASALTETSARIDWDPVAGADSYLVDITRTP